MEESEAIKIIKEKACNNRCIPQLCNDGCMYKYTKCAFSLAIHALENRHRRNRHMTAMNMLRMGRLFGMNGYALVVGKDTRSIIIMIIVLIVGRD